MPIIMTPKNAAGAKAAARSEGIETIIGEVSSARLRCHTLSVPKVPPKLRSQPREKRVER